MLFKFGIASRSLCSFCISEEETSLHIFHNCTHTQNLCNHLQTDISENFVIPTLTRQSAMFPFTDNQQKNCVIIKHIIFLMLLYLNLMFINQI